MGQPVTRIGPAMPFSKRILEQNPKYGTIELVPCALNGSSISRWQRGRDVYGNMTARAEAAVKNGGKIEALLWWQGGADSDNIDKAHKYKEDLTKSFQDIRADLKLPELLIIQVVILYWIDPRGTVVIERPKCGERRPPCPALGS
ncbi:probable carbohydrate esterase At4g34215 [Punica granatum]|uniref:Probable carbohydrate esterase At4g34215 n=1 Tax=Punica granatum TaxID=22663 RepID=A0A6P8DI05_PUNGR|nr:probable carbohydrate esterase At4g34215 [Punica granatum]